MSIDLEKENQKLVFHIRKLEKIIQESLDENVDFKAVFLVYCAHLIEKGKLRDLMLGAIEEDDAAAFFFILGDIEMIKLLNKLTNILKRIVKTGTPYEKVKKELSEKIKEINLELDKKNV